MAKEILDTIMSIQPKDSSSGGGETRESVVFKLADGMLAKLPADYIPHEVRSQLHKMGAMSSMNIFLRQEVDRMQRVISLVRQTLQDLKLAIEGTIIMSEVSFFLEWKKNHQIEQGSTKRSNVYISPNAYIAYQVLFSELKWLE